MSILDKVYDFEAYNTMKTEKLEFCLFWYKEALKSDDSLSDERRAEIAKKIGLIQDILEERGGKT